MNKIRSIVRSTLAIALFGSAVGTLVGISGCGAVAPNWDNQHQAYVACEERVAQIQSNGRGGAVAYSVFKNAADQWVCNILPSLPPEPTPMSGDCVDVGCKCDPAKANACLTGSACIAPKGQDLTVCLTDNNRACRSNAQCASGFCNSPNTKEPAATCKGLHGDECQSDINCADVFSLTCIADMTGTKRCLLPLGGGCSFGADCASGQCDYRTKKCVAPSCDDGYSNGAETGLDCGGPTCPKCGDGQRCVAASDCQSNVCTGGKCTTAPTCTDKIKNGAETDVDCGGGTCAKCDIGQNCGRPEDCKSNLCSGEPGKEKCANP